MASVTSNYSFQSTSVPQNLLSERFKYATMKIHERIEDFPLIVELKAKTLTSEKYHAHLVDLHQVYSTLEEEIKLNLSTTPPLKAIYFPLLERASYIKQDLDSHHFLDIKNAPSTQAESYTEHLRTLGRTEPLKLIAHSYTRYLGDLSGGLAIKSHIQDLWPDATNYYDFSTLFSNQGPGADTPMGFKAFYKAKLDTLQLAPQIEEELIQEVLKALDLSGELLKARYI